MSEHGTQSIDRAADLLSRVVLADAAITFTALAADTGYARSTTSRLLAALERADLLGRDTRGAWVPGPLFAQYAARQDSDEALVQACTPVMQALGDLTGETVNLAVPRSGTVVQIAQVDSTYFLGSRDWVGVDVPAHCSALGKVLYAYAVLDLPSGPLDSLTPATLSTTAALAGQLTGIRQKGFATTVDELEVGLTAVAAPVFHDGAVVAAIGLSGPTQRLSTDLSTTGTLVAGHARALSTRLSRHRKEGAA